MKANWVLLFVLAAVFSSRLFLSFQQGPLPYDEYYNFRQVEHIRQENLPIVHDELSYGGRDQVVLPLAYYAGALLGVFYPAIMSALVALLVYFLSFILSKNEWASIFSSVAVSFMPQFATVSFKSYSPLLLGLVLMLCVLISFMLIGNNKNFLYAAISAGALLIFTDSLYVYLVASLLLYVLFIKMEDLKHSKGEVELIIFLSFFSIWISLIIFRSALNLHGIGVFTSNLPLNVIMQRFSSIDVLKGIFLAGVLPFFLGIIAIYLYIFRRKNKNVYLFVSVALVMFFSMLLGIISLEKGIIVGGISLAVLSALALTTFFSYLEKTHFQAWTPYLIFVFALLLLSFSVVPSMYSGRPTPSQSDLDSLKWLSTNSPQGSVVIGLPYEGSFISAISLRKNVMDENYILADRNRYDEVMKFYSTYETDAVRILNKYDVNYVFFSGSAQSMFAKPIFLTNKQCFEPVYEGIFKSNCQVTQSD